MYPQLREVLWMSWGEDVDSQNVCEAYERRIAGRSTSFAFRRIAAEMMGHPPVLGSPPEDDSGRRAVADPKAPRSG
jgi:hypothetical protein